MPVDTAQVDVAEFPFHGTCDQCSQGDRPLRSASEKFPDAWICAECIGYHERAIKAALDAAHGHDVDEHEGFHRDCPLSKAVRQAITVYCEYADG